MAMIEKAKPKEPETAEVDNDEGEDLNAIAAEDAEEEIPIEWDPDSPNNVG